MCSGSCDYTENVRLVLLDQNIDPKTGGARPFLYFEDFSQKNLDVSMMIKYVIIVLQCH